MAEGCDDMEKADRQFENMRIVARERLLRHTPQEVSRKAGVRYEDGMYLVDTLGKTVSVRLPDCTVLPQLSNWHTLTLLHYLDLADGAPPSGCMISFSQYKDGLVRGGGLDRNAELIVRRDLGVLPPEELARRCLSMGAELLPSNADFCAHFSFLPTVDSKVLRTWRTGAHRHRVAAAIDFVVIAITLAMLATSPTIAGCLHTGI